MVGWALTVPQALKGRGQVQVPPPTYFLPDRSKSLENIINHYLSLPVYFASSSSPSLFFLKYIPPCVNSPAKHRACTPSTWRRPVRLAWWLRWPTSSWTYSPRRTGNQGRLTIPRQSRASFCI